MTELSTGAFDALQLNFEVRREWCQEPESWMFWMYSDWRRCALQKIVQEVDAGLWDSHRFDDENRVA